jgi:hypothetical protein
VRRTTVALVAAAATALGAGAASAATPVGVVREVMAGAPGRMPTALRCVSSTELLTAGGRRHSDATVAVTVHTGPRWTVLLDQTRVCRPLYLFRTRASGASVKVVDAVATVLHEKAHVNGVLVEWRATCAAIPGVLSRLRRWGYTAMQLEAAQSWLTDGADQSRSAEYRLAGRCRI